MRANAGCCGGEMCADAGSCGGKYADESAPPARQGPGAFFAKCLFIRMLPRLHDAIRAQAGDFVCSVADLGENRFGMLAKNRRRP